MQIYTGLDLSRKRLDWQALRGDGTLVGAGAVPPDPDGLAQLVQRLGDADVLAVVESMNGARFIHDRLERAGWDVRLADPLRARALAPLACKTDRIDCWVLAELARRDLIPEVWLPDPAVRQERERARFRLHLVKHRTMLKNRIHQTLIAHGHRRPGVGLYTQRGRALLARLELPEPWRETVQASLALIDALDVQIAELVRELRRLGAEHPYVPLLRTVPGIAWVLAYTIASEIGEISRFPSPRKLIGYTGLCPASTSPANTTAAARSPRTALPTCAGRWSKRPTTPPATPSTASSRHTNAPGTAGEAPRSPRSRSPASSPRRSGGCSPATSPLLGQAPEVPDRPTVLFRIAPEPLQSNLVAQTRGRDRGMSVARPPQPRARDPDPPTAL